MQGGIRHSGEAVWGPSAPPVVRGRWLCLQKPLMAFSLLFPSAGQAGRGRARCRLTRLASLAWSRWWGESHH